MSIETLSTFLVSYYTATNQVSLVDIMVGILARRNRRKIPIVIPNDLDMLPKGTRKV